MLTQPKRGIAFEGGFRRRIAAALRRTEFATARMVLRLAYRERGMMAVVAALGCVSAVFEAVGLSFLIPLTNTVTGGSLDFNIPVIGGLLALFDRHLQITTLDLILLVFGFFFLGVVIGYVNGVVSSVLAMRLSHRLRVQVFDTAMERSVADIESLPAGKLVNNLASETWRVSDAAMILVTLIVQATTCAIFLAFLVLLSPTYTATLLAIVALTAVGVHLATRKVRATGAAAVAANEALMAYIWDALAGLRVIRGFGREPYERQRFREVSGRVRDIFIRLGVVSGLVRPISQVMAVAAIMIILAVAVWRGDAVTTLVGYLAIAYRMQPQVSAILGSRTRLTSLDAPVAAIEDAVSAKPPTKGAGRDLPARTREITLEGVSARYPKTGRLALQDISCVFASGQVTAIVGFSGAGKSTLVALLLRFLEPDRGRILVDGVPLSDVKAQAWHRRIAFVEQNAFLFNASVRDNIRYGDLDANPDAIQEAAQAAQAHDFIADLAQGYDTMIGEHGVRLSQGQRQRIALARALVRQPDVLILDEATNALDAPTDRSVRAAIESGRRDRLVIVIAHRRQTIGTADHVLVLHQGRLVEAGRPSDLAAANGLYTRLYHDESVFG
jgi:ATP-binding cassette, subfamily B, bacterial MsbA